MILAVDVHYRANLAVIAGIGFDRWTDASETGRYFSTLAPVLRYIPGRFYQRELPCILKLINQHRLVPDIIVIDGYVQLDARAQPGLGLYLYQALGNQIPIIGVAKNPFKDIPKTAELLRGRSSKPLYITSVGIAPDQARKNIREMFGAHRIPALLKKVDRLSRSR